jgi:hypothetical protein
MTPESHNRMAEQIAASLARCSDADYEAVIEGAMLAASHWVNSALHTSGLTKPDNDMVHTYMLTANELQKYRIAAGAMLDALIEIERIRPLYVRGNVPGGEAAARRARELLDIVSGGVQAMRAR